MKKYYSVSTVFILSISFIYLLYSYHELKKAYDMKNLDYDNLLIQNDKLLALIEKNQIRKKNLITNIQNIKRDKKKESALENEINNLKNIIDSYEMNIRKNIALKKLEKLREQEVIEILENILDIKDEELPLNVSSKEFATKLLYIATNNEEEKVYENISFVNENKSSDEMFDNVFDSNTKKITATFDTSSYEDSKVLTKWINKDTGDVLLFDFYKINPDIKENYIWLEKKNGWKKGNYKVEMYSLSNNLEKISSNEFNIND